jgi:lipid A 3-O-deacylase
MPRAFRPALLAGLLLALAATAGRAGAQVEVTVDNDLFGVRGADDAPPDYEYTHGLRGVWRSGGVPRWLRAAARACGADDDGCARMRWEVGQKIFTPRRDAAEPLPGERPYAGWLYAAAGVERAGPRGTRSLRVEAGMTGAPSLAEPVQTTLHRLAGYRKPLGWRNQLGFEPALALRYDESRVLVRAGEASRFSARVAPEWGAAVGTLWTGAAAGVRARLGYGREIEVDGARARGVYLTGGVRGEWVARNLFLDGSTFRESPSVRKRPLVGEADAGLGVRHGRYELRYRTVFRGREYRTQSAPHRYGSITFVVHPAR